MTLFFVKYSNNFVPKLTYLMQWKIKGAKRATNQVTKFYVLLSGANFLLSSMIGCSSDLGKLSAEADDAEHDLQIVFWGSNSRKVQNILKDIRWNGWKEHSIIVQSLFILQNNTFFVKAAPIRPLTNNVAVWSKVGSRKLKVECKLLDATFTRKHLFKPPNQRPRSIF